MSTEYDETHQSMVASGDKKQGNPKDSHCDSETMKCPTPAPTLKARYVASMVLSGVGDAMGYHRGDWEFNKDGVAIHNELETKYKGLQELKLKGIATFTFKSFFLILFRRKIVNIILYY